MGQDFKNEMRNDSKIALILGGKKNERKGVLLYLYGKCYKG